VTDGIAVRIDALTVHAGATPLLGPLDLEIAEGEHLLLVGPSGCGKTTLLRAIAGLTIPSSGRIELFGRTASEGGRLVVPPEKRGVGMLFQGGALWPHMSVRKTLAFVLKHGQVANPRERIAELVHRVRLEGLEDRTPATLSGGEKQRLALARALAVKPRLLLLDEPLGPLDAGLRTDLLETLAQLHAEERWSVLHVTHDPAEALRHASRILRMEGGMLQPEETRS
jgi:iron(III) transport system ATP-binding protein